jgi:hypothetical protein
VPISISRAPFDQITSPIIHPFAILGVRVPIKKECFGMKMGEIETRNITEQMQVYKDEAKSFLQVHERPWVGKKPEGKNQC